MTSEELDPTFKLLLDKVRYARGFDGGAYKSSCLKRRVAVRMRARQVHTYADYAQVLDDDDNEYDRLLDALTINVTKFFRNFEMWDVLSREYLPKVWDRRNGALRFWSAGCSSGEEPYTIAMLVLHEAMKRGLAEFYPRIDASDFDRRCLEFANRGVYRQAAFDETPRAFLDRYVVAAGADGEFEVRKNVRDLVRFSRHDLTREAPPNPPYDFIFCRNVVIYFDRATQEKLFQSMADALSPGGYLVLGKVETLVGGATKCLTADNVRERVYRRP